MNARSSFCRRVGGVPLYFLLLVTSCGIPSTSYLPPVPVDSVVYPLVSETAYAFAIPDPSTIVPDIFEGFELYYKLFRTTDSLDGNGDDALSSPVSRISLQNAGYSRMAASTETPTDLPDYPLIILTEVEKGDPDVLLLLDFSNVGASFPTAIRPGGNIKLSRTLTGISNERLLKGFRPEDFVLDDSDLPEDLDPTIPFDITIALYVLSYGNNFNDFDFDIHSSATYIGNTRLILDQ